MLNVNSEDLDTNTNESLIKKTISPWTRTKPNMCLQIVPLAINIIYCLIPILFQPDHL